MNTFNRKSLYAALAGLGALSGVGAAEAVNLAPEGLGQALIYPYYTVRNGANGFAYNTLISVVNTTASAKAVKVRFLEGKNSKEVLDFNLFLSKFDVWTATVVATANGGAVTSGDNSCILPSQLPAAGQPFVNFAYSGDGADQSLDRTREGYVEILEMATFSDISTTALIVTHKSNGLPGQGTRTCADNSDTQAAIDARTPQGGLFGGLTLINVFDGSAYSQVATALANVYDGQVYNPAGDIGPTLADVSPAVSVVIPSGTVGGTFASGPVITDWAVTNRPVDAVSAVLMHNQVINEYATDAGLLANTDWVVTMPTKNKYVNVGTGSANPPFQRNFNGTKGACDDISIDFWDREEKKNSTPGGFSPPQPGVTASLCWEANVVTFKSAGVLGSTNSNFLDVNAKGFINGWAELTFIYTNAKLRGGATTQIGIGLNGLQGFFSAAAATYSGLPVVGFAVQSYNNNVIVVGGKNVQSTYGADFAHKTNTSILLQPPAP
jgi:hypothetical protein